MDSEETKITPDVVRRLYDLTLVGNTFECWPWVGAKYRNGAGYIRVGKRRISAHRVAYADWYNDGVINDSHNIAHKCDDPSCCNPYHLYCPADVMLWTTKPRRAE